MSITVQSYLDLDSAEVEAFRNSITALVQEYNPNADLKRGPVQDLFITPKAAMDAGTQENIDLIRRSNSLQEIAKDPSLADTDVVDRLLSNYGMTRKAAAKATGNVVIVLSQLVPVIIARSVTFTIDGQVFVPTQNYAGRTSSIAVTGAGDRLISAFGSNFYFVITVTAQTAGSAGNVKTGASATLSAAPVGFSKAYVQSDFTGGIDAETNEQLLARQRSGLASKTWSNRASIEAMIREQFPALVSLSIIGFGDSEMLRDQHQLWPGSLGGRSDIYVRPSLRWQTASMTKTATLISIDGTLGTWQIGVERDDAPGFYQIDKVLLPSQDLSAGGFSLDYDERAVDLSVDDSHSYIPDIATVAEGTYTAFQTATVRFVDTSSDATGKTLGETADYVVVFRFLQDVGDIQTWLGNRDRRPPLGDVLVKAAIPCFTVVGFSVSVRSGTTVDTAAVRAAVAAAVNNLGFSGQLAASTISQAVYSAIGSGVNSVGGFSLTGRIRRLDGSIASLSDPAVITIPDDPANGVTSRTVVFFLEPTDVLVTVNTASSGS